MRLHLFFFVALRALVLAIVLVQPSRLWAAELSETWYVNGGREFIPELVCPKSRKPVSHSSSAQSLDLAPPDPAETAALESIPDRSGASVPLPVIPRSSDAPLSVAIWGDSHTAAGFFSEQLLATLGLTQQDAVPSFIPPTVSRPGVRLPLRKSCRGGPWQTDLAYTSTGTAKTFGRALARAENTGPGASLWLDFRRDSDTPNLTQLEILFSRSSKDSPPTVKVTIDDAEIRSFQLWELQDRIIIKGRKPFATVKVKVEKGDLWVDGFVPTYSGKHTLVLDTLSIPGATVRAWKAIDPMFLRRWGPSKQYDLAVLQYGTNEGNAPSFELSAYRATLRESLRGFRAAYPKTSCVLIGPTDRGVLVKRWSKKKQKVPPTKNLLFYSRLHYEISQTQAEVGREFGCTFWSWQHAMGGPGSIYRWQRAQPPLAANDLIHLTTLGYQESARRFVENLKLRHALGFPEGSPS